MIYKDNNKVGFKEEIMSEDFAMSIELVCFWLFSPVYYQYIKEEVLTK